MPVSSSRRLEFLEEAIGHRFLNRHLLFESVTHRSFHHESQSGDSTYNERLEFLGDSVLGLVIAETLHCRYEHLTEADMSKMKACLVNTASLFEIASSLSLGEFLMLGRGEEATGGRQKRSILSDAFEALIGAIFLDSDYPTVRGVVLKLFEEKVDRIVTKHAGYDFKSELQERSQGTFGRLPEYRIVRQEGEEHMKVFTAEVYVNEKLCGTGRGKSKKEAQVIAAREALKLLGLE